MHPYRLVKDIRSKHEMTDVEGVMDGQIDPFLKAYLMSVGQETKDKL